MAKAHTCERTWSRAVALCCRFLSHTEMNDMGSPSTPGPDHVRHHGQKGHHGQQRYAARGAGHDPEAHHGRHEALGCKEQRQSVAKRQEAPKDTLKAA